MILLRTATFLTIFAFALSLNTATALVFQNIDSKNVNTQDMDRSVKPGDDFYRYANGGWLKTVAIPAGQPSYDTQRHVDGEDKPAGTRSHSRSGRGPDRQGSVAQKVGDYYASFMDEDAIEAKG